MYIDEFIKTYTPHEVNKIERDYGHSVIQKFKNKKKTKNISIHEPISSSR